jgi:hypothetical protein
VSFAFWSCFESRKRLCDVRRRRNVLNGLVRRVNEVGDHQPQRVCSATLPAAPCRVPGPTTSADGICDIVMCDLGSLRCQSDTSRGAIDVSAVAPLTGIGGRHLDPYSGFVVFVSTQETDFRDRAQNVIDSVSLPSPTAKH